jgi:hypothetical protein
MNNRRTLVALVGLLALVIACGPLGNLGNMVSGSEAGTATRLWDDVPPYPGADRVDMELPLVLRLAVEGFSQAIMNQAGDAGGNLEFIAYTTGDSPEEVQAFYNQTRMEGEGWANREDTGCNVGGFDTGQGGAMCAYYKEGTSRDSALIIVAGPEEGGETSIFYIRIDANPEAMATAAAQ